MRRKWRNLSKNRDMKNMLTKSKDRRHDEIISRLDRIIALLNGMNLNTNTLVGKTVRQAIGEYYTNDDLCKILRITKRTLARYRQRKLVSYYMIDGKVYYKVAEVQEFLQKKGKGTPEQEQTPEKR